MRKATTAVQYLSRRWRKRGVWIGLTLCVALLALLIFPELFLCVRNEPVPCDAIVVLGGQPISRAWAAAALAANGLAPRVIVSGAGDCEDIRRYLQKYGMRTNVLELECDSQSTEQNARFTAKLLRDHGCKQVIIVTSWYHSRRALSSFHHCAPEIHFISAPVPRTKSWREERRYIIAEYAKIVWYAVRWRILPFVSS